MTVMRVWVSSGGQADVSRRFWSKSLPSPFSNQGDQFVPFRCAFVRLKPDEQTTKALIIKQADAQSASSVHCIHSYDMYRARLYLGARKKALA